MKRILVPLDGSLFAEQALPLAAVIAARQGGEIVLLTAVSAGDRWGGRPPAQWHTEEQAAAGAYLQTVAEGLRDKGARARTRVDWQEAADAISSAAEQEAAGFIVMTTHGRSGLSRWVLGSVADKVLRTASTPLILIRPVTDTPPPKTLHRITVALDGSKLAEAAIPEAERLARTMGASLLLVRAVVPAALVYGAEGVPGALPVLGEVENQARRYLERTAARLRKKRNVEVSLDVSVGAAAEVILEASRRNQSDLISITTHGRSGLERVVFGSVADAVVRHSELPVLVIRSWSKPRRHREAAVPVAGDAVVPAPVLTETEQAVPSPRLHRGEPRRQRPERSPGR
jgi:nucleotide-binding universal stress UspA family protein